MEQAEKILLFNSQQTSEEKVELLFRSYYPMLCKSLYRILRSTEEAEDVVQEVFLKLWDRRQTLEINNATVAYLYRACYHASLNVLRQRKPHEEVDNANLLPGTDTADQSLELQEVEQRISWAIDALPPKTRLVFSLSRYDEMSYKAIAAHLDISVKAVEKHMGIALERLRTHLHDLISLLLLIAFLLF